MVKKKSIIKKTRSKKISKKDSNFVIDHNKTLWAVAIFIVVVFGIFVMNEQGILLLS